MISNPGAPSTRATGPPSPGPRNVASIGAGYGQRTARRCRRRSARRPPVRPTHRSYTRQVSGAADEGEASGSLPGEPTIRYGRPVLARTAVRGVLLLQLLANGAGALVVLFYLKVL